MRALVIALVAAVPGLAAADEPEPGPVRAALPPPLDLPDLRGTTSQLVARVTTVSDDATATTIELGTVLRRRGWALRVRLPVLVGPPPRPPSGTLPDAPSQRGLGVLTTGLTHAWTWRIPGGDEQRFALGAVVSLPTATAREGSDAEPLGRQLGELTRARAPGEVYGGPAARLELSWQWRGCAVAYQASLRAGFATIADGYYQDDPYAYLGLGLGAAIALGAVELLLEAHMVHDSELVEGVLPFEARPSYRSLARAADVGLRLRALPAVTAGLSATLAYDETFAGAWVRVGADLPFGGD